MPNRLYHVWFSTKGRRAPLQGDVGRDVKDLLVEIARRARIDLADLETAVDHVHLLLQLKPQQTLPAVMHQLKGASSRLIQLKYPELKTDIGHQAFWQKSYSSRKIEPGEFAVVRRYIRTQENRPLRHE